MNYLTLIAGLLLALQSFAQDYYAQMGVSGYYGQFQENTTQLLYGDNVVLRKKPTADAKAIDTLSIGSEVTIIKNTEEKITVNGRVSNWYQVKTDKGSGYIAGGLIAQDSKEHNGGTYLVITAGPENEQKFRVRYLKDGDYYGKEGSLGNSQFQLKVNGSRGVQGLEGMLIIQLFSEACGHDGGQHYIFNDGERLYNAIHCSSVAEGGVFWFTEELEFPDEREWGDHITYKREFGESVDEVNNHSRSVVNTVIMNWNGEGFTPNIHEMVFEDH